VFAAAAAEILPQVKHELSPGATLIGGAAVVATMLGLKAFEARFKGTDGVAGGDRHRHSG
jgi:ZIP family zinc transporter